MSDHVKSIVSKIPTWAISPTGTSPFKNISLTAQQILFGAFILLLFLLTKMAWANRFIQDDAFISFRYAENFVNGYGFTWNPGVFLEGYTNFLWTVLMTIPIALGIDVVGFVTVLGMLIFFLNLVVAFQLAKQVLESSWVSLFVILALGLNFTFSAYATGGLETGLQTLLFQLIMLFTIRLGIKNQGAPYEWVIISFLFSLALLTRLDSAIIIISVLPFLLSPVLKEPRFGKTQILPLCYLAFPAALIVGTWLGWKLYYYGDIFPNTYYAKASNITSPSRGLLYLYAFFYSYWLFPFLFLSVAGGVQWFKKENRALLCCGFSILLWMAYIVKVGGDFMEFRFMVPILPFLIIASAWIIFRVFPSRPIQVSLMIMLLLGSLHHYLTFSRTSHNWEIERIQELNGHLTSTSESWVQIGKKLEGLFRGHESEVLIAVGPAGAIPFYSKLRSLDMLGINDKWVARYAPRTSNRPGHQRSAPLEYLIQNQVHLVIGHPQMVENSQLQSEYPVEEVERFLIPNFDKDAVPLNSKILGIPISTEYTLLVLYLTPNPRIEHLITQQKARVFPLLWN